MSTNDLDPLTVALQALVATLGQDSRARRLLDLTGLTADELRERAADPALLSATLAFLESHEPDLLAVAAEIGRRPEELVAARRLLDA
ncbi:DUF3572 family protein [Sphingomonas ginkgonis]|uniref:DUF3572 family protein n=1 Tax=Sphingomonas ginkgonis TaxID=2315330 RepID=A0A3R9WNU3_9SPHN|nr:DUF3572 family protein [Sphingomonas ginkgonis]RST29842.1 DUF3572 family protein [Sphingomonas ginkgonis]